MYETLLATTICGAVKAHPACVSLVDVLQWRVPETKDALVLPAVSFGVRDVVPVGVGEFCTGILEVKLEAQSDDETSSETQIARANLITAAFNDVDPVTSLRVVVNGANPRKINLSGYAKVGGGRGVEGRRWTSTALYKVGFAPVL